MIQAMLWKEYREHRSIWLTLTVGGGACLFVLARLMESDRLMEYHEGVREPLLGLAVLLAWTYGLVGGSILLAGEREGATLTFLDMLPMRRLQLWLVKCLIGLILFLAQVAVLTGFLIGLGVGKDMGQTALVVLWMVLAGLIGMSWGLLFSARGESVIGAIGLALGGQIVSQFVIGILSVPCAAVLAFLLPRNPLAPIVIACLAGIIWAVGPVVGSALIFSRPDRLRRHDARPTDRPAAVRLWASWGRLLWLSYHQMRRLMLGVMLFALAMGFLIPAVGVVVWPVLTLFLGVLCGVTVCGEEQAFGSFRFLGDQRFPLGRVWIVKVAMRFALAVLAAFLLLLPGLVLTIYKKLESQGPREMQPPFIGQVLHSSLIGIVVPTGVYLILWLLYGFSVGHLCGLLFRKSLVAAVAALSGTMLLVSVWLPSLLGMGLHFWQIAGVPAILLVTAWLLMPAWTADRLVARGTFARLGAALAAVVLWTAGGLWYRVTEIPDVPDQLDMPAFVAGLPTPEKNKAGELMRSACAKLNFLERDWAERRRDQRLPQPDTFWSQPDEVLEHGWSGKNPELAEWLDAMLQDNWLAHLAEVPDLPPGVFESPKLLTMSSPLPNMQAARRLTVVLALRGLQRQAEGDDAVFVDHLRIGLAVSRSLQHDSPLIAALVGRATEGVWLTALDRWLEKLRGQPEQLKRVLHALLHYDAELPDEREPLQAEYLMALNTLEQTPEVFWDIHGMAHRNDDDKIRLAESQVATMAWLFPWEQERHQRILRVMFQGDERERREARREWGDVLAIHFGFRPDRFARPKRGLARLRAAQLKVALRLYQAETGKPAKTLDVLLPRYLPAIPLDPFDGRPFRYRLSDGERIGWPPPDVQPGQMVGGPAAVPGGPAGEMPPGGMAGMLEPEVDAPPPPPPPPTRFVPAGQGILWSVGEDGQDDGGVQQSLRGSGATFGEDIIYLVPPPRK